MPQAAQVRTRSGMDYGMLRSGQLKQHYKLNLAPLLLPCKASNHHPRYRCVRAGLIRFLTWCTHAMGILYANIPEPRGSCVQAFKPTCKPHNGCLTPPPPHVYQHCIKKKVLINTLLLAAHPTTATATPKTTCQAGECPSREQCHANTTSHRLGSFPTWGRSRWSYCTQGLVVTRSSKV